MAITGTLNAFEASVAAPRADATAPTVDQTGITADARDPGDAAAFSGFIGTGVVTGVLAATEGADIAAISGDVVQPPVISTGGGYYRPPPSPVIGYGYGVLPELEGEAHGAVVAASIGAAMLPIPAGEAAGAVGARGHSEGQLRVQATARGARGSKGAAAAVLDLGAAGSGAVVARGAGFAVIVNSAGHAIARHDDDEAVIAWLLAA